MAGTEAASTATMAEAAGTRDMFITPQYIEATGFASARRIMQLCKDGTIKAVRFGRVWRIYRRAFCEQYGIEI